MAVLEAQLDKPYQGVNLENAPKDRGAYYEALRNTSTFLGGEFPDEGTAERSSINRMRAGIRELFEENKRFQVTGSRLNWTSVRVEMLRPEEQEAYQEAWLTWKNAIDTDTTSKQHSYTIEALTHNRWRVNIFNQPEVRTGARAIQMIIKEDLPGAMRATSVEFIPSW